MMRRRRKSRGGERRRRKRRRRRRRKRRRSRRKRKRSWMVTVTGSHAGVCGLKGCATGMHAQVTQLLLTHPNFYDGNSFI